MSSEKPVDLYDDGTMRSGGSEHGTDDEHADQADQKHGEVVKESMRMREGYYINVVRLLLKTCD